MNQPDVVTFNSLSPDEAQGLLGTCLGVPRWARNIEDGRPYAGWAALREAAELAAAELSDEELAAALTRHPRIGERLGTSIETAQSRLEQAAANPSDDADVAERLAAGNADYERRFGRVFLIRAAGRAADEILAELNRRLDNDDATERSETLAQLGEIALLRLERLLS